MSRPPTPKARVFAVETRFQQMARRPGGVSRERAIEQAENNVESARPDYDAWLDIELRDLSGLVKKTQSGHPEPNWIESAAFRSRDLRDSATALHFELLSFIAGSLCEVFDAIEAGSECSMEAITCHVDALTLARKMSYRHLKPEQVPELVKGLRQVVKHVTT
jgi:hypothetical protein